MIRYKNQRNINPPVFMTLTETTLPISSAYSDQPIKHYYSYHVTLDIIYHHDHRILILCNKN